MTLCPEADFRASCAYDEQGRALLHATDQADADVPPWEAP